MRFADTVEGWQSQINYFTTNTYINAYIKAISKEELQIVPNQKHGLTGVYKKSMCHANVEDIIKEKGGTPVYGWVVNPYLAVANDGYDGIITSMFHCNWLSPEGELINITPMQGSYHVFLPDRLRKWDFETNSGYNNRTIYLDHYSPPKTAFNPSRNCTYFTAGQYASRDKLFEKFSIPNNIQEAFAALPAHMKRVIGGEQMISPEGMQWISLRYTIAA